jgi:hypothetical protein
VAIPLPQSLKLAAKACLWVPRRLSASGRLLPDFIIIGGQKCGTTSLYNYLRRHPSVAPVFWKEVHFFDLNWPRGVGWYRAHFPSRLYKRCVEGARRRPLLAGEASPYYLFHPQVPRRVFETLPGVKLIALLRDPAERAYSHYHHEVRAGRESLSFEEALAAEPERLRGECERLLADEGYRSYNHQCFSYLARGLYADQLARWLELFPRRQLLVIKSEEFRAEPGRVLRQVEEFLGLSAWEPREYRKFNPGRYEGMSPEAREWLREYFAPHNRRLSELLGASFQW